METNDSVAAAEGCSQLSTAISGTIDEALAKLTSALQGVQRYERRIEELERCKAAAQLATRKLSTELAEAEQRVARVTSLYVATYQLHASLDLADVRGTIAEIAINLLGAERFALLLRPAPGSVYQVALEQGLEQDQSGLFADGYYVGREPMIDQAFADGVLRIAESEDSPVLAVVPLMVQDAIVGALVILKLLQHRGSLAAHDRDLLDLLGAHAASALFVAQVHSNADRKLKTLESLVRLAQRA